MACCFPGQGADGLAEDHASGAARLTNARSPRLSAAFSSVFRGSDALRAQVVAARLGLVAAFFHRAPTAIPAAALIQKQPSAPLVCASAQPRQFGACDEIGGGPHDGR